MRILIIGSRGGSIFSLFSMKHKENTVYLYGKGIEFEKLGERTNVLFKEENKGYNLQEIHFKKYDFNLKLDFDLVLFSIRESHINAISNSKNLLNIARRSKLVMTNLNLKSSSSELSKVLGTKVYRAIIFNGVDFLSPDLCFIRGNFKPLHIIIQKNDINESQKFNFFQNIFKQYKIINEESELYKQIYLKRKILTLLSFLSLFYKMPVGSIVSNPTVKEEFYKLSEELLIAHHIEDYEFIDEIVKSIVNDKDIFFYYPTHFKNFYIRNKDIRKDIEYYFDELKLLYGCDREKCKNLFYFYDSLCKIISKTLE